MKNLLLSLCIVFTCALLFSPVFLLCGKEEEKKAAPLSEISALRAKAASGDKVSAFFLADAYFYGKNVRKNPVLALYWYRIAAQKGIAEAQYNLACCLESGSGCRKNMEEACFWYRLAAEQKFVPAVLRTFHLYRTGVKDKEGKILVRQSLEKGIALLKDESFRENEEIQILLGSCLLRKGSTEKEQKEAFELLSRLEAKNKPSGVVLRMLADCYYGGLGCEKNPEKMVLYLQKAAALQDPEAVAKLGFLWEYGLSSLPKDLKKAFACYRKAAFLGHAMGQYKYAEFLLAGAGKRKEILQKALVWYQKSASQECGPALHHLGVIYRTGGDGIERDLAKAAGYFFRAAKSGYAPAQYSLALMFRDKQVNGREDSEAAFYWFLQAALQGHLPSLHEAAACYLEGRGVERSFVNGVRLLRAAAEKGDFEAQRKLQIIRHAESYSARGSL